MKRWQLQEAKARLSELIAAAKTEGPQEVTVRGKPAAVVLAKGDFDRLVKPKPSFVEFMRASPLVGAGVEIRRDRSLTRRVRL